MPIFHQQRRLLLSFGLSLLLHALLLGPGAMARLFSTPPQLPAMLLLQARLLPPHDIEPLLKDTLSATPSARVASPDRLKPGAGATARQSAVQSKLAEHLYYPPEAVARGLEGEVRLLLMLDPHGRVVEARVASGSGHSLLDRAAVDAAYAMRRIPAAGVSELILPVVFKLQ